MKALLFDMDGVLVDVSCSYRKAIQETVAAFTGESVAEEVIRDYKNRGGFNNDWDLTERILLDRRRMVDKKTIIKFFQDVYLGENYSGLIRNETWLMEKNIIQEISSRYSCGIVTGRPAGDAGYVLKRFEMESFFPVVITMDQVPEDKQKPHPLGLLLAMADMNCSRGIYFGDNVDDMKAAGAAGVDAIGIIPPGADPDSHKKRLLRHGAVKVLDSINDIAEVLS